MTHATNVNGCTPAPGTEVQASLQTPSREIAEYLVRRQALVSAATVIAGARVEEELYGSDPKYGLRAPYLYTSLDIHVAHAAAANVLVEAGAVSMLTRGHLSMHVHADEVVISVSVRGPANAPRLEVKP